MELTESEQLGLALRREKAVQTKWQPVGGWMCEKFYRARRRERNVS
jgi:hypothetical protein